MASMELMTELTLPPPRQRDARFATLQLVGPTHPQRAVVEAFIAGVYRDRFSARIHRFMPALLAFYDDHGRLSAALGLRLAGGQRLFVEQYLDDSAEHCIGRHLHCCIDRTQLAEIGGFAAAQPGDARAVIMLLTRWLHAADVRFVLFAATTQLRNTLSRLRLPTVALATARAELLSEHDQDWGRYYDTHPQVVFGEVGAGLARLDRHTAAAAARLASSITAPRSADQPCP